MERIRVARTALAVRFPYFGPLSYRMTLVECQTIPTMAVDRRARLYYNPEFVNALSEAELLGVLWHEVMHVVRAHTVRGEPLFQSDPERANVAADLEINDDAVEAGVTLPGGKYRGVFPADFGLPNGRTMEEYFERLGEIKLPSHSGEKGEKGKRKGKSEKNSANGKEGAQNKDSQPGTMRDSQAQNSSSGNIGSSAGSQEGKTRSAGLDAHGSGVGAPPGHWELEDSEAAGGLSREEVEILRRQVAQAVLETLSSPGRGTVPQGLARWAKEYLQPKANWRSLLRHALRKCILEQSQKHRPTYSKPNRRASAYQPYILPGHYGLKPRVGVVIDTSASMGSRELSRAMAEVRGLLKAVRKVRVYSVDCALHEAQTVFRGRPIQLYGNGGTDMAPGIAKAEEEGANLIVVLTDGMTPWQSNPPKVPTVIGLVANPGSFPPPSWGVVVRIEE